MKPSSAKAKGRIFQQWVKGKILGTFPQLAADDVRSTGMGQGGEDVQLSPKARQYFPFQVECKSRAAISIYGMFNQAASHGGYEPILFIKENRGRPLVVLDAEYFFNWLKENSEG